MVKPDPRSGVDESGRWSPAFPGQRPPLRGAESGPAFEPGNEAGVRHGAFSERRIRPLAEEWRKRLDAAMREARVHDRLDDIAREQLARSLARADLLEAEIEERTGWLNDKGELTPAAAYLFKLDRTILAQLRELGLTVRSRHEIGLLRAEAEEAISAAEVQSLVAGVLRASDTALAETLAAIALDEEIARRLVRAFRPLYLQRVEEAAAGLVAIEAGTVEDEPAS